MNASTRTLFVVSSTIFLVSLAVAGYVFYTQQGASERLMSLRENIDAWDRLNRASANLNDDDDNGPTADETLESLVLKNEGDTIAFLGTIDGFGKDTGVLVSTSELKEVKTSDPDFEHITATISLRGSVEAIDAMIELLQNLPYHAHIKSLTLTRINGDAEAVVELLVSVIE